MAYTRAWNELVPNGGEDPGTIDDQIRALKEDIRERMEHVVEDWDADPVVPIEPEAASFAITDQTLIIPIFAALDDNDDRVTAISQADGAWVQNETGLLTTTLLVPIVVPVGITIKNAGIFGRRVDGSETVQLSLYRVDLANPEVRTLLGVAAAITAVNTWEWATVGVIAEVTTAEKMYFGHVSLLATDAGDAQVSAIRIVYDSPSANIRI